MLYYVLRRIITSHSYRFYNFSTSLSFTTMYWANLKQKKRIWKLFFLIFPNFSNPHFSKDLTYEKTGKVKKYSVTTIVLTFTVWITCSSVILNFSRVLRPRKVNLKNITNSWPSASNLQNFFSIHFSWPHYPGKIQNYTRTNFSHSRSEQLW